MMIYTQIKSQLKNYSDSDKNRLVKALNYKLIPKGLIAIDKFISSHSLEEWLDNGYYDFRHNSMGLYKSIATILGIDKDLITQSIEKSYLTQQELKKFQDSYIFVQTNFKKTNQSIIKLGTKEHITHIKLDAKDLIFKTENEVFGFVSSFVKKHYEQNRGKVEFWGDIKGYVLYKDSNKIYCFDSDGELI